MKKKFLSTVLSLLFVLTLIAPVSASVNEKIPFVFIHGMMGWGENGKGFADGPYWGMNAADVPGYLRSKGYDVAVPTVGPMSSAWDRACEVYAQLTGTVVDYGAAHSEAHHHSRFGRDYTGRALLDSWDGVSPINIVTHSFGGPAGAVFASLMEYGSAEEIAASPDDCSGLFTGGKPGTVYSLSTLASPHNGVPLANILYYTKIAVFAVSFVANAFDIGIDFMFDQYGITADPSTGEKAVFNPSGILALAMNDDHCAYDMTLKGAAELYEKFPAAQNTYYYSYSGDITEEGILGTRKLTDEFASGPFAFTGTLSCLCAGKYFGFTKVGREWANNDGLVPVVSARAPFGQAHEDYAEGMSVQPGVWYAMPTVQGASHGYHVGGTAETLYAFYDGLTETVG